MPYCSTVNQCSPCGTFCSCQCFFPTCDIAHVNIARITTEYLDEDGIEVLAWPAADPDLNLIRNHLHRHIRSHNIAPDNVDELEHNLLEEWENSERNVTLGLVTLTFVVTSSYKGEGFKTSTYRRFPWLLETRKFVIEVKMKRVQNNSSYQVFQEIKA